MKYPTTPPIFPPPAPITDSVAYLAEAGNPVQPQVRALEIVRAWHNDTHPGVFQFCDAQPCHAINRPPA